MIRFAPAAVLVFSLAATAAAARAGTACPAPTETANPVPVSVAAPKTTLRLRVADTWFTREYGLMCVTSLAPQTGMIFVFGGGDRKQSFWMKNTLIPLDMVFVRKNGRVDTVAADVPSTTTDTPEADIPWRYGMASYVIELAAGEAAKAGIVRGATLDLSHVGPPKQ